MSGSAKHAGNAGGADIADCIVNFYNAVRLHATLGCQSPSQYEQQHLAAH